MNLFGPLRDWRSLETEKCSGVFVELADRKYRSEPQKSPNFSNQCRATTGNGKKNVHVLYILYIYVLNTKEKKTLVKPGV